MGARAALKKLADRKEQEIRALRLQLAQAEAYLQAIQDSIKVLPREEEQDVEVSSLRQGTAIAQARDILKDAGEPLHILEILKRMGRVGDRQNRVSLSGSLAAYVRRNQVFRKAGPNTFALIDGSFQPGSKSAWEENKIPGNFGQMNSEDGAFSSFSPSNIRTSPQSTEAQDISSVQEAVSHALESAGHVSAAQLLRNATWSNDNGSLRIEVNGMGRKMLALTVNAAAERSIEAALAKMGLPKRFLVLPSAAPSH